MTCRSAAPRTGTASPEPSSWTSGHVADVVGAERGVLAADVDDQPVEAGVPAGADVVDHLGVAAAVRAFGQGAPGDAAVRRGLGGGGEDAGGERHRRGEGESADRSGHGGPPGVGVWPPEESADTPASTMGAEAQALSNHRRVGRQEFGPAAARRPACPRAHVANAVAAVTGGSRCPLSAQGEADGTARGGLPCKRVITATREAAMHAHRFADAAVRTRLPPRPGPRPGRPWPGRPAPGRARRGRRLVRRPAARRLVHRSGRADHRPRRDHRRRHAARARGRRGRRRGRAAPAGSPASARRPASSAWRSPTPRRSATAARSPGARPAGTPARCSPTCPCRS